MRILHCPELIGGQATNIARHERALGAESVAASFSKSAFGFPADEILWSDGASLAKQETARWHLFLRALRNFDVIHYNFGTPILNWGSLSGRHRKMVGGLGSVYATFNRMIELPAVRLAGNVIAVTYQGDDARQGDYSLKNFDICIAREVGKDYYSPMSDQAKRDRIAQFARYANLMYALNPDLLRVLPAKASFLPYAHIDMDDWRALPSTGAVRPLVVHAPSHKGAKGTRFVLAAVERLRAKGISFDFLLVEGMTQQEARKSYERADLVIDQLLAGWYGGFAVEAMALGKPVICYLRHEDFGCLPRQMRDELPLIEANPDTIETVLQFWLTQPPEIRMQRGMLGRSYVEKWHDPRKVAERLLGDYSRVIESRRQADVRN